MLTRTLMLTLIAGTAWTSQASAAAHSADPVAQSKTAMANDAVPRLVDTTPERTADTTKANANREAAKVAASSQKRQSNHSDAKQKTQPRAKMKSAARTPAALKTKAATRKDPVTARKPVPTQKPERYVQERERGLDTAAIYAPKAIARLRRNRTIERVETAPEGRASGWRYYVDTYAKGR